MKRTMLFIFMILGLAFCAFAQDEKKMAVGLGLEFNMNSRKNFAGGIDLGFDYNLPNSLAVGLNVTASTNFSSFYVIEPAALFRWYFLRKGHTGFFAQADMGAFIIFEKGEVIPMFLGGLRVGYRFPLRRSFFIEPYGHGSATHLPSVSGFQQV